jgi:hypothetical protein
MDNPLQNAIQKMGNNFIVAAFVPSMAFILLSSMAFFPVLPKPLVEYLGWEITKPDQTTVVTGLLFTTILGFTLSTLSTYIYKSFEGYTFILGLNTPLKKAFIKRQKRRIHKMNLNRASIERELEKLNQIIEKEDANWRENPWLRRRLDRYKKRRSLLKDILYALVANSDTRFPPSENLVLPSRFGNILRAAEMYPGARYNIDAVPIWGRMAHIIPKDAMEKIDQANNQCLFLLNSALLATMFSFLSGLAGLYIAYILQAPNYQWGLLSFMKTELNHENVGIYVVLAILSGMVAWFFYEASLLNVSQFGSMIRTAYDLYRFDLLEKLNLPLPKDLNSEKDIWQQISEFFVGGDAFGKVNFNYYHYSHPEFQQDSQPDDASLDEYFAQQSQETD